RLRGAVPGSACPAESLLVEFSGAIGIPETFVRPTEHPDRRRRVTRVPGPVEQPPALLRQIPGAREVLLVGGGVGEEEQGLAGTPIVPEVPVERQRLLRPEPRRLIVSPSEAPRSAAPLRALARAGVRRSSARSAPSRR